MFALKIFRDDMKIIKFKGNILRLKSEVDVTSKEHLAKVVTQKSFAKKKRS